MLRSSDNFKHEEIGCYVFEMLFLISPLLNKKQGSKSVTLRWLLAENIQFSEPNVKALNLYGKPYVGEWFHSEL